MGGRGNKRMDLHIDVFKIMNDDDTEAMQEYLIFALGEYSNTTTQYFLNTILNHKEKVFWCYTEYLFIFGHNSD